VLTNPALLRIGDSLFNGDANAGSGLAQHGKMIQSIMHAMRKQTQRVGEVLGEATRAETQEISHPLLGRLQREQP
jgi:hypothetical protein